jgi:hypothetical protein
MKSLVVNNTLIRPPISTSLYHCSCVYGLIIDNYRTCFSALLQDPDFPSWIGFVFKRRDCYLCRTYLTRLRYRYCTAPGCPNRFIIGGFYTTWKEAATLIHM